MSTTDEIVISRFQDNLESIRKVAGWTAQELADEIGVTRQTISNLENHRSTMTKTQYLALRTVLNFEIMQNQNNALALIVKSLVDDQAFPDGFEDLSEKQEGLPNGKKLLTAVAGLSAITAAAAGSAGALRVISKLPFLLKR